MIIYIFVLLFMGLLCYIEYCSKYSKTARILSKIPGPKPVPILGNALLFKDKSQRGMWITVRKLSDEYYPITKGWMVNQPVVSIRRPDDLEVVLSSQKSSFKDFPYTLLRSWLNNGLFSNRGDTHKNRRKMVTPAFHFNMLRRYVDIMNKHSDRFVENLKTNGKEFSIDVLPIFADVSLNIIIETAMGIDLSDRDKQFVKNYKEGVEEMGDVLIYRMTRPYIKDWMMIPILPICRKHSRSLKMLHEFTNQIINERRKYHKANGDTLLGFKEFTDNLDKQDNDNIYIIDDKKKLPMLDILLSAEKDGLVDATAVREEVDTFLLGGTDTTRMVLAYVTLLLAENKDCQDKVRAEVVEVINACGGNTGIAELQDMPYLEQCIKESMRLYPIGATLFRYTIDNVQLKGKDNYVIPPGVIIICNIFDAHRDKDYWEDPEKFNPDRFSPNKTRKRHPYCYLPFSAGPRNCVGQKFGMLELKSTLSRLIYNFYLEPVDHTSSIKLIADLVLRPQDPYYVKFVRIDRD